MSIPRSVAEVLLEHVTLEVEGIDRMYLNVYPASSPPALEPAPAETMSLLARARSVMRRLRPAGQFRERT